MLLKVNLRGKDCMLLLQNKNSVVICMEERKDFCGS